MPIEIRKNTSAAVMQAIRALTKSEVLVGVPAENAGRSPEAGEHGTPLNNAEIGYIHEFGSTIEGANGGEIVIPPRPHLIPGITGAKDKIAKALGAGAKAALSGKADAPDLALNKAGLIGQAAVRAKITEGDFTPLAASTLAKRRAKGRTGTKPLIDTGAYRNSINYVVRKKGED